MGSELQNIPPLWTAVFHWLAYLLYVSLLPQRRTVRQSVLIAAALLAIQFPYMRMIAPLNDTAFNLGMTGFALLTFLPFPLLCRGGLNNYLYYCARAFILGGFTVSLAWQFYSYYSQRIECLKPFAAESAFMLLVGAAIYVTMYFLERTHLREILEMPIQRWSGLSAVFIAFVIYILSSLSYSSLEMPFTTTGEADIFNIRTIVYFGGVAILYAYHLQICDTHVLREVSALQNVLDMQYANYQQSQKSIDMVNRKYHDLKHQLAVLRAEIETRQKLDSLEQIERDIRAYESQNQTGNKVLDAILTSKSFYCLEHDIIFTCIADGSALDFLDVVEISALFGNALDNAIEAVSKLTDPEQRLIRLSVTQKKGFLRIKAENRCLDDLVIGEELPKTTKEDKGLHGYGLKSIRATAEKYGGSVTLQAENGWFTLGILIPQPMGALSQTME